MFKAGVKRGAYYAGWSLGYILAALLFVWYLPTMLYSAITEDIWRP